MYSKHASWKLNWYQWFEDNEYIEKLSSYAHVVHILERENRSFHVVEKKRTAVKCTEMKIARAKRAKLQFFIVKYANLGRPFRLLLNLRSYND